LIGARAPDGLFQHGCRDRGNHRGVDRLPEDVAELIVISEPQGAADFDYDGADLECGLILPCPDTALVKPDLVIDPQGSPTCVCTASGQCVLSAPGARTPQALDVMNFAM
jgi:hypothetical protein